MGLLDRLGGSSEISLSPKSALALAAMTLIGADGVVEEDELAGLRRIVRGDDDALQKAFEAYKAKNIEDCIRLVVGALDEKQRIAALANLLDIAMADGVLADAEEQLLGVYLDLFGISEDAAKRIIDVIAIKNDFSVF